MEKQEAVDDFQEILLLVGRIFFYGGFRAETPNEKRLEELMRKHGFLFLTEDALLRFCESSEVLMPEGNRATILDIQSAMLEKVAADEQRGVRHGE